MVKHLYILKSEIGIPKYSMNIKNVLIHGIDFNFHFGSVLHGSLTFENISKYGLRFSCDNDSEVQHIDPCI